MKNNPPYPVKDHYNYSVYFKPIMLPTVTCLLYCDSQSCYLLVPAYLIVTANHVTYWHRCTLFWQPIMFIADTNLLYCVSQSCSLLAPVCFNVTADHTLIDVTSLRTLLWQPIIHKMLALVYIIQAANHTVIAGTSLP